MRKRSQRLTIPPEPWRSIAAKWGVNNPFQLFGDESLFLVLGNLSEGRHVSLPEFRRVLHANAGRPIPPSLLRTIRAYLKRQGPTRRGRRSRDYYVELLNVHFARILYGRYLKWLQSRSKEPYGLECWSCIRRPEWWRGPPHERAARMVSHRLFGHHNITWRHVRNLISSRR